MYMKLSNLGEFGLIDSIKKKAFRKSSSVLVGIGDDAAVLKVSSTALLLATTDLLLEGVHFDLSYTDFYSLGWKSAAVNLSDIAAMGGIPRFCLTSLGIPPHIKAEKILDFYRGFNALLRAHKTVLTGGDTSASSGGMIISVTVLGEVEKTRVISRAGAKPGDRIFVTGTLGDSAAGLELLQSRVRGQGSGVRGKDFYSAIRIPHSTLVKKHLRPIPRIEWGRKIALSGCASALIDISDGLSSDLHHICGQSGVGAVISAGNIPLSPFLLKSARVLKKQPLQYGLSGGEDYELLFTVPSARINKLNALGIAATEIGEITRTRQVWIVDDHGRKRRLQRSGYDHFKRSAG